MQSSLQIINTFPRKEAIVKVRAHVKCKFTVKGNLDSMRMLAYKTVRDYYPKHDHGPLYCNAFDSGFLTILAFLQIYKC